MLSGQHALASDSELIGLAFQVIHLNPFLIFFKNKAWSFHNRGLTFGGVRVFFGGAPPNVTNRKDFFIQNA
jgi:hypothetical protein